MQQHKFKSALKDFQHLATMDLKHDRTGIRCQMAICLARLGRHTDAAAEIAAIRAELATDALALYDAAAAYSLCAAAAKNDSNLTGGDRAAAVQRCVVAAVALLERLRDTGFLRAPGNLKMLLEDPQFAPLLGTRPYEDFVKGLRQPPKATAAGAASGS